MSTLHKSTFGRGFCQATRTGVLTCLAVGGPRTKSDSRVLRARFAGARLGVLIAVQRRIAIALVTLVRRTRDRPPSRWGSWGTRMVSSDLSRNASCVNHVIEQLLNPPPLYASSAGSAWATWVASRETPSGPVLHFLPRFEAPRLPAPL